MNPRLLVASLLLVVSSSWTLPALAADRTVMIVTWRGCEEACQGFQDYLRQSGADIDFQLRDAAQDLSTLGPFLEEARAEGVDLIATWGTSVTRGIAGTLDTLADPAVNTTIPQVFMIVADPVGARIVESLDAPGRPNVTGTFNRVPETVTIATMRRYLPSFGHLGMLFNSSETNSVLKRDEMAGLAATQGLAFTSIDVDTLGEVDGIAQGFEDLRQAGVDFVYLGSSSMLRSNANAVGAVAIQAGLPLLSPYEEMVRDGTALISIASRYYDVGRLAGEQAERILVGGASAGDLPVARMTDFAVTVNITYARAIGIVSPIEILQFSEIVE